MQPADPILTPLAWPIVSVMSTAPSHPPPRGDSHQGPYGKDWEESCDWSFLLSPNHSNTAGRTTVSTEKRRYVCTCAGLLRCTCECQELYLHADACLRVHVCTWDEGSREVTRETTKSERCVCEGMKDSGLTLNMWPNVRNGHVCGHNP